MSARRQWKNCSSCESAYSNELANDPYKTGTRPMANWFQDHAATSIVTYTLLVVGATWATSTFILQDNRLNLAKSEPESQKTLAEQYRSKAELLQKDIEALRVENQEYRNWLGQSKDAIPLMVPRLLDLKKQVAR